MRVAHSGKPAVRSELLRKALGSAPELRLERDRRARRLQRRLPRRPASCTFGKLDVVVDQDMASSTFVKANFLDPKQGKKRSKTFQSESHLLAFSPPPLVHLALHVAVVGVETRISCK